MLFLGHQDCLGLAKQFYLPSRGEAQKNKKKGEEACMHHSF